MDKKKVKANLAESRPDLAEEWHPTRNGNLKPHNVSHASNKKVWWLCSEGHEWETRVAQRSGCPYCSGRLARSDNNLAVKCPELAAQWHPTKNGDLTPFDVVPGSSKAIWWQCEAGHEWKQTPCSRRGCKRCPYCANRRVTSETSLATTDPTVAAQWHPTRNGNLTPDSVVRGSGKTVWWKCENGHEWRARVVDRANGRRCAFCLGQKAHPKHNLAIKFPELAKEWHPSRNGELTPYLVAPRSNKKVWWQCNRGHEWESTVSNRAKGQNCPDCRPNTSSQEIRIFCELKIIFGKVEWRKRLNGVECDILLPDYGAAIEYDGAFWHESRAKEDKDKNDKIQGMGIELFRVRAMGLPKTSDRDLILSIEETRNGDITVVQRLLRKMLQTIHPQAEESERVTEYLKRSSFANSKEHRRILSCLPGPTLEGSLAGRFPDIARQWHPEKNDPLTPEMFSPGTPQKVWWLCEKGHEWKQRINHRAYGVGCPFCAGQKADLENNLAVKRPDIAEQWHPTANGILTPSMFTPYSNKMVWWICSKGHKWQASIHNRSKGTGCPYCAGQKVSAENNLAARAPEIAQQWHPTRNGSLTPDKVTHKSNRRVWWQCAKGHEWQASPNTRSRGNGCPHCRSFYGLTVENNFASRFPQLAWQWHPTKNGHLRPNEVTPFSGKRVWWVCENGHEWQTKVDTRAMGKGCPQCWKERPRKRKYRANTGSVQPPKIHPKPKSS